MRPLFAITIIAAVLLATGCTDKPRAKPRVSKPPATTTVPLRTTSATWKVASVHDGDTLRAIDGSKVEHKIRLVGIDAPETGQAFGTVSRDHLRKLVMGKAVEVQSDGQDRYGRTLGRLLANGVDVNRQMVADGMAWHFTQYSKSEELAAAERDARKARKGLWSDAKAVAPWVWRKGEKARKAAPGT
jgi:endonuclease YncB( thermonuclease family)